MVYRARQKVLQREVAVKRLRVESACGETLKQLASEARTLAALRHLPRVVDACAGGGGRG